MSINNNIIGDSKEEETVIDNNISIQSEDSTSNLLFDNIVTQISLTSRQSTLRNPRFICFCFNISEISNSNKVILFILLIFVLSYLSFIIAIYTM